MSEVILENLRLCGLVLMSKSGVLRYDGEQDFVRVTDKHATLQRLK